MPIFRALLACLLLAVAGCASRPPAPSPRTVVLVSVDGLRPADIDAEAMPRLHALGEAGVRAEGMRPSYPSLTFPNHYTLVTGLRPDRHGIVHNSMADAALGLFRTALPEAVKTGRWWSDATPIWVSVERAGLHSAVMFWPGSEAEIHGRRPWQWRTYRDGTRAADSAMQVERWLSLPASQRPRLVMMYLDQVDEASHDSGPDSPQAQAARGEVDAAIGGLLDYLRGHALERSVDILVVSDHGFATVPPGHAIATDAMAAPEVADAISDGQVIGFAPKPGQDARARQLLLGRHDHYECWRKEALPARWRYGTHPRIPAIVCQMDPGWDALWPKKYEYRLQKQAGQTRGSHGYDPDLPQMRATFIAGGPSFRPGARLPVFDNVDVYPLLMRLLGLPPQPNDGDARTFDPVLARR